MLRLADVEVILLFLAVLVLGGDRPLVAELHPCALRLRGLRSGGLLAVRRLLLSLSGADGHEERNAQQQGDRDGADARNASANPRLQIRLRHVDVDLSLESRSECRSPTDVRPNTFACGRAEGNKRRIAA